MAATAVEYAMPLIWNSSMWKSHSVLSSLVYIFSTLMAIMNGIFLCVCNVRPCVGGSEGWLKLYCDWLLSSFSAQISPSCPHIRLQLEFKKHLASTIWIAELLSVSTQRLPNVVENSVHLHCVEITAFSCNSYLMHN